MLAFLDRKSPPACFRSAIETIDEQVLRPLIYSSGGAAMILAR